MKGISKELLIKTFMHAQEYKQDFVYVMVELPDVEHPELIVNPVENVFDKLDYYMKNYNDKMELIANKQVRVVAVGYADSLMNLSEIYV